MADARDTHGHAPGEGRQSLGARDRLPSRVELAVGHEAAGERLAVPVVDGDVVGGVQLGDLDDVLAWRGPCAPPGDRRMSGASLPAVPMAVTGGREDGRSCTSVETTFRRTKQDVADKVRKLLAKAEDPAATPEEAESCTAKAQQLMTKYAIDLAMVADPARADALTERGWTVEGPYASHKVTIINAVARANDCRAIYAELTGGRKRIDVVGFASDAEWVETLSRSLEVQLASALAAAVRSKPAGVHGRTYSVAFVQGFASEISSRLQRGPPGGRGRGRRGPARATDGRAGWATSRMCRPPRWSSSPRPSGSRRSSLVRHPSARTVYKQVRLRSWSGYAPGRAAGRRASARPRRGRRRPAAAQRVTARSAPAQEALYAAEADSVDRHGIVWRRVADAQRAVDALVGSAWFGDAVAALRPGHGRAARRRGAVWSTHQRPRHRRAPEGRRHRGGRPRRRRAAPTGGPARARPPAAAARRRPRAGLRRDDAGARAPRDGLRGVRRVLPRTAQPRSVPRRSASRWSTTRAPPATARDQRLA